MSRYWVPMLVGFLFAPPLHVRLLFFALVLAGNLFRMGILEQSFELSVISVRPAYEAQVICRNGMGCGRALSVEYKAAEVALKLRLGFKMDFDDMPFYCFEVSEDGYVLAVEALIDASTLVTFSVDELLRHLQRQKESLPQMSES